MLDIFALLILAVLLLFMLGLIAGLGALPGVIAHRRGHPQAEAIMVGGWVGLAAGGVLWPVILIWAFTRPANGLQPAATDNHAKSGGSS
jgi:hypothetical protein